MSSQGKGTVHHFTGKPSTSGSDGGDSADMNERLAKLEEAISGLKDRLTWTTAIFAIILSFLSGLLVYSLNKTDRIEDKIDEIPGKVNLSLQQIVSTLSASITAARQQAPQVILVPTPIDRAPTAKH